MPKYNVMAVAKAALDVAFAILPLNLVNIIFVSMLFQPDH